MPQLRHFNDSNGVRFLTFSCYRRLPLLADDACKEIVLRHIILLQNDRALKCYGFVIMSNHLHMVLTAPEAGSLTRIVGGMKSKSAKELSSYFSTTSPAILPRLTDHSGRIHIWQARGYDHNCRDREAVIEKVNYCHQNPVKAGIVRRAEDWKWSSAGWYAGEEAGIVVIDRLEL